MRIEFDNTKAIVLGECDSDNETYQKVRRATKAPAPGARFTRPYKEWKRSKGRRGWDGKTNILQESGHFPTGYLPMVVEKLWKFGRVSPTLVDKRPTTRIKPWPVEVPLRNYQVESFNKGITNKYNGIWWPRGVFDIATGGGKTELAVAMFEYNPCKTLFLVNRKSLARQTVERFRDKYGWDCGKLYGGHFELDSDIVVATVQSVVAPQDRDWETKSCRDCIRT